MDDTEDAFAFGVNASSGMPIEGPPSGIDVEALRSEEERIRRAIGSDAPNPLNFSVPFGYDPDVLADVGWGLVFQGGIDPAPWIEALDELLMWRRDEAGAFCRVFSGADGYQPGESASAWLNRHGSSLNQINPDDGVPYYLVVVGPPSAIPFAFQYSLDIVAAVGRLDFPSVDGFRAYARSVVAYEKDAGRMTRRRIGIFATCHDFDRATQLFTKQVARPLIAGEGRLGALGKKQSFAIDACLEEDATKAGLLRFLTDTGRPPSVLFTGTHGMAFDPSDPRQADHQGALVCQDWPGYGSIAESHWFAAQDVPATANVHGLIHFFFACYGAGTPEFDDFRPDPQGARIAPAPMTARLPQRLLTLPQGGALASLGHIDRAWASSFQSKGGMAQNQGMREVIERLLAGQRVGHATDNFNLQWAIKGTELTDLLLEISYGKQVRAAAVLALRIARDDCRNYVVLGDPAVRLRAEPALP